tara:strand:- start:168 stop:611 length:444 start_codon:yes stop_codon:yes gene_type:complete
MTNIISGKEISTKLAEFGDFNEFDGVSVWIPKNKIFSVCYFLKNDSASKFGFLRSISAVDYIEYFEIVYHLVSFDFNNSCVLKTKCYGRADAFLPSVTSVWAGADLQEREIYDLMGVRFEGHPNMKRILLWEGFEGHPLRKDFTDSN